MARQTLRTRRIDPPRPARTSSAEIPSPALVVALGVLAAGEIPVPMRAKRPLLAWTELRDRAAPLTVAEVVGWWRRWPDAGVARIIPEGQVVVDLDPRNGGAASIAELPAEVVAAFERAVVVWSGRDDGGRHAWFAAPGGARLPKGPIAPGLDLLPAGNLEILPPSIHAETSRPYRWGAPIPRPDELADLPAALTPSTRRPSPTPTGPGRPGGGPPMRPEHQAAFAELWAAVGVALRNGEALYRCPWHDDAAPSLSIHAERGVWACHAGCGHGGLRDLRKRVGRVSTPQGIPRCVSLPSAPEISSEVRAPRCPTPVPLAFKRGRVVEVRSTDCRMRECPVCGPRRAAEVAAPILADLEGEGLVLFEALVEAAALRAWKARVDRRGHARKQYPAPGGRWRVFTTCPDEGAEVDDPQAALLEAYAVAAEAGKPQGPGIRRRNVNGSRRWAVEQGTADADLEVEAAEADGWQCLGVVTASATWAQRQAEKVTGSRPQVLLDAAGRRVGWRFRLADDDAEANAQEAVWVAAAGVVHQRDLKARQRRARDAAAQLVRAPSRVAA